MSSPTAPRVRPSRRHATTRWLLTTATLAALAVTACSGDAADPATPSPDGVATSTPAPSPTSPATSPATPDPTSTSSVPDNAGAPQEPVVQLVTHDSFTISDEVWDAFTDQTGYTVEVLASGDAGTTVNAAVLTAGNPQGDVLFGVDNTLLSRALEGEVFVPYEPADADALDPALVLDDQWRVTPIDRGDVCLNYDVSAYADSAPPSDLQSLTEDAYAGQLVVENPATSSPGLAFLLATYATFGEDGWEQFWQDLVANDVAVSAGWEDAYYGMFSGAAGSEGDRPLVVSYASSPPAEVIFAEQELDEAPTGVVAASCFQQVEFAGVLAGTDNEAGARALVDFMISPTFQADIPLQMFVFPARQDVQLPAEFVEHAVVPEDPISLDPATIDAERERLVQRWTEIVLG